MSALDKKASQVVLNENELLTDPHPTWTQEQKITAILGLLEGMARTTRAISTVIDRWDTDEKPPQTPPQQPSNKVEDVIRNAVGYRAESIKELRRVDGAIEIYLGRVDNWVEFCKPLNDLFGGKDNVFWNKKNQCLVVNNWKNKGYL